jgi:hypothetical protein
MTRKGRTRPSPRIAAFDRLGVVKRFAILLLVALLLLLVAVALPLPVPGAMWGMAFCPECLPSDLGAGLALCLAVLATFVFLMPRLGTSPLPSFGASRRTGGSAPPDHPPRSR